MWVKHCFKERYDYYYNLELGQGTWEQPEEFQNHLYHHLGKEEIQVPPPFHIYYHCHLGLGNVIATESVKFLLLETNLIFFSLYVRVSSPLLLQTITENSCGWPMNRW